MNKIKIYIILLTVFILMLPSCKNEKQLKESDANIFINNSGKKILDQYVITKNNSNILIKINIETGAITNLCVDPLCNHNEVCPSSSQVFRYWIINGYVYYMLKTEIDSITKYTLFQYDISTVKSTKIYESQNNITSLVGNDNDLYFTELSYEGKDDKGNEIYITKLYKCNGNNGDITYLTKTKGPWEYLICSTNQKLFFGYDVIYSTNLDYSNRKFITSGRSVYYCDDEYLYCRSGGGENAVLVSINGDGEKELNISLGNSVINSEGVFFQKAANGETIGYTSDGKAVHYYIGCETYILRKDENGNIYCEEYGKFNSLDYQLLGVKDHYAIFEVYSYDDGDYRKKCIRLAWGNFKTGEWHFLE